MIIPGKDDIDGIRRDLCGLEFELMTSDPDELPDPLECGKRIKNIEAKLVDLKLSLETQVGVIMP